MMLATSLLCFALAAPEADEAAPASPPPPRITSVREADAIGPPRQRPTAPGAWQRLTLIGTLPSGTNLWLLGSARPGTSWALGGRTPGPIVDEVLLAIAAEIRQGWPMLFIAGGMQRWNDPGGPRTGGVVMAGITGDLGTLTTVLRRLRRRR